MSDEGFLGRWSRRKRAAAAEAALAEKFDPPVAESLPAVAATAGPAIAGSPAPAVSPDGPEPSFDPTQLPAVDTLTATSDIRDFLRPEVPTALRQAALRRAWALDPTIAGFIGPADYAWDFNAPDGITGFSPTLAGDVGRMLEQAIGLGDRSPPRPGAAPDFPDRATSAAPEGIARPPGTATDGSDATIDASIPEAPPVAEAAAPAALAAVPMPAEDPAPASGEARWRHGSAAPV